MNYYRLTEFYTTIPVKFQIGIVLLLFHFIVPNYGTFRKKNSKVVSDRVLSVSAFLSLIIAGSAFDHLKGDS